MLRTSRNNAILLTLMACCGLDLQAKADSSVAVFLSNNGVHIDIGVPAEDYLNQSTLNWDHLPILGEASYLIFGWGDAKFLSEHDTWDSVTISDLWTAAFASPASALRIVMSPYGAQADDYRLRLCPTSWQVLVKELDKSIATGQQARPIVLRAQLAKQRFLFQSPLQYAWDNNCNHWVAAILQSLSLPTPWLITSADALMAKLIQRNSPEPHCQTSEHATRKPPGSP